MPCTRARYVYDSSIDEVELGAFSFPGGNAGSFRHIVKYLIPESITGEKSFEDILFNPINFAALDRPNNAISIRLNSTAIDIRHEGPADTAKHVNVTYQENGVVKRVKAKTVVSGIGGWVGRNIIKDLPPAITEAYKEFYHSPILVVNVAVRHWRFLDELGISSARWFKGFGNFFSIRRPMDTGEKNQPFEPNKPAVMTFYVPFNNPGHPIATQGAIGRAEMLSKSYADYEKEIVVQMNDMFAGHGFNAQRDIAGIVLNRWGHAYISPQPGFHFGKDGKESPKEIVKKAYGRIQFGHSELDGYMSHTNALTEGSRAALAAMKLL
jgi:spermidine dehydrogenase